MPNALIVDDHASTRQGLAKFLEGRGLTTAQAPTLAAASELVKSRYFETILLDVLLPDGSGLDLLMDIGWKTKPHVVLISGEQSVMRTLGELGFHSLQFLPKPVQLEHLEQILDKIREQHPAPHPSGDTGIIGESRVIRRVIELIDKVAPTDLTVLVRGETGTGKELVAAAVHARSHRRNKPFVPLNCGAVPESLIDAELFGHDRGAFTGASTSRQGAFEVADGGTLFLDEITEMPLALQSRLLRVLESGRVKRVGATKEISVDVRVVCATNRIPAEAVAEGKLREDVFHRLAVFPILVPPLRRRGDDVVILANHFLAELGGEPIEIEPEAMEVLKRCRWPGNVRQLRNLMHRLAIVAEGNITADLVNAQLGETHAAGPELDVTVGASIAHAERQLIEATLEAKGGDKRAAAAELGISLRTLYNRLQVYRNRPTDRMV